MRKRRKFAAVVSGFLQQHYGIRWSDISAKLRAALLAELERVPCNLCGGDAEPVASRDKYGLPVTTVMCRGCGLLYLDPRPTAASYRRFYEGGGQRDSAYHRRVDFDAVPQLLKIYYGPGFEMDERARAAMARFMAERGIEPHSQDEPDEDAEPAARKAPKLHDYAVELYESAKEFVPAGGKVFEAGASVGKKLMPWKVLHGCEATGIEPKQQAVRDAKRLYGLDLMQGFADDPRIPENAYDLVLNTQTINHMLDPLGDLRNAWRWLKPDGILLVDIEDAIKEARYEGFERGVIQIDHPYMFSLNTLRAMVQKAGFAIVRGEVVDLRQPSGRWYAGDYERKHIRIVARKSAAAAAIDWPNFAAERAALTRARRLHGLTRLPAQWVTARLPPPKRLAKLFRSAG
jgi:SAM-dependent methyltransferase